MATVTQISFTEQRPGIEVFRTQHVEVHEMTTWIEDWLVYNNQCEGQPAGWYAPIERTLVVTGSVHCRNDDLGEYTFSDEWVIPVRSPKPHEIKTSETVLWYCVTPMNRTFGNTHLQEFKVDAQASHTINSSQEIVVLTGSAEVGGITTNAPCSIEGACTVTFPVASAYVVVTPAAST